MKNLTSKILLLACLFLTFMWYREYSKNLSYQVEPDNLIASKTAEKMRLLFLENQYDYINKGLEANYQTNQKDYNNFSVSIKNLKGFISKTEQLAKETDYENLGIRFHLAATKEGNVPKTTLYYHAIGSPEKTGLKRPIRWDTLRAIPGTAYADKIYSGQQPKSKQ